MTALAAVSAAVKEKAQREDMGYGDIAAATKLTIQAVSKLWQFSDTLTLRQLLAFADWAGLELTATPKSDRARAA